MISSLELELLVKRLLEQQPIDVEQADSLAEEIGGMDQDILDAALEWARTGVMPHAPVIGDHTPSSLAERYYPSQNFSILFALRQKPEATMRAMKTFPTRAQLESEASTPS